MAISYPNGVGVRIKQRPSTRSWSGEGNCYLPPETPLEIRAEHTAQFFPKRTSTPRQIAAAKRVCDGCPVRAECLAYSISNWDRGGGIWGGETETERRVTRKAWDRVKEEEPSFSAVVFAEWWIRERQNAAA